MHDLMTPAARKRGLSPLYCSGCRTHFTATEQRKYLEQVSLTCRVCGADLDKYADVSILPSSQKYIKSETVRSSSWYHATHNPRWMLDILEADPMPMVHIGTRYAALDRATHAGYDVLYKIEVDTDARIWPLIWADMEDRWNPNSNRYSSDIYRYANRWESPGSISLFAKPTAITVVSQTFLT